MCRCGPMHGCVCAPLKNIEAEIEGRWGHIKLPHNDINSGQSWIAHDCLSPLIIFIKFVEGSWHIVTITTFNAVEFTPWITLFVSKPEFCVPFFFISISTLARKQILFTHLKSYVPWVLDLNWKWIHCLEVLVIVLQNEWREYYLIVFLCCRRKIMMTKWFLNFYILILVLILQAVVLLIFWSSVAYKYCSCRSLIYNTVSKFWGLFWYFLKCHKAHNHVSKGSCRFLWHAFDHSNTRIMSLATGRTSFTICIADSFSIIAEYIS